MAVYHFELKLLADAEPASGLGNELLNALLPRGEYGAPIIPASHLKGVMRENLYRLLRPLRADAEQFCDYLFGRGESKTAAGIPGILHISDAVAPQDARTLTITRTAIDAKTGRADDGSLRTSEALAAGTVLTGLVQCDTDSPAVLAAIRLAFMNIFAIGGGRTRGAGVCRISIREHEKETPGKLLAQAIVAPVPPETAIVVPEDKSEKSFSGRCKALKLTFRAEAPLCLPTHPVGMNNVISSGFVIAGTAVTGTLLALFSKTDKGLASACWNNPGFRCGPLLPVPENGEALFPVYISNTHKISKLRQGNEKYLYGDQMIPDEFISEQEYHWQKQSAGVSMKGVDGVLAFEKDGKVHLLRSSSIPRIYRAHGVVNGGQTDEKSASNKQKGEKSDNLYSMESICAKCFSGMVILPEEAADKLLVLLKDGAYVSFGKAKTTQGFGQLTAEPWTLYDNLETEYPQVKKLKNRLFIVQTPIVFENKSQASSEEIVTEVLHEAGWGELEKESAMTSVLFGWNNLKLDKQINGTGRVQAKRVILPGSVFLLKEPLSNLSEKIRIGLGTDRAAGYGFVLPHPMFATELCENVVAEKAKHKKFECNSNSPVFAAYKLHSINGTKLSSSQIARLYRAAQISEKKAMEFLEEQRLYRPEKIWKLWDPIYHELKENQFKCPKDEIVEMLRVWHDLRNGEDK